MFSSKNTQMNERKNRSKVTRYAIKKLSMGTASVAVALGFLFVQGQSVVLADTVETTQNTTETKAEETSEKVEATTEETTTTSEEQAPRTRTRREAGDAPAATAPVGSDVEDATAMPKLQSLVLQRNYRKKNCLVRQVGLILVTWRTGVEQRLLQQDKWPYKKGQRIQKKLVQAMS